MTRLPRPDARRRLSKLRPSPAMAVAFLALFAGIAGTAAAGKLISGRDIRNNSVTSRDIKNGTLVRRDFRRGQLRLSGPRGPAGPPGPRGAGGVSGLTYAGDSEPLGPVGKPGNEVYVVAACPAGRYPIGGDAYAVDANPEDPRDPVDPTVDVAEGFTVNVGTNVPSGWFGRATNTGPRTYTLFVDAICADANPPPRALPPQTASGRRQALTGGRAR